VAEKTGSSEEKPVFFVFHGGSGSSKQEVRIPNTSCNPEVNNPQFKEAISYGVVKVNLDTDMQVSSYDSKVRQDHFLNNNESTLSSKVSATT
jgi:fructose-bisphosphate aldolase class II